jgi:hypothetical protein
MRAFIESVRESRIPGNSNKTATLARTALICTASGLIALAQTPTVSQPPAHPEREQSTAAVAAPQIQIAATPAKLTGFAAALKNASHTTDGAIDEEQIKQVLVGKTLYLRGDYLDNSLSFDLHGNLTGQSARGSYTLCSIRIDNAKFSKHKVELNGDRYALHFLGELPHQDPLKDVDRVKITPKKKIVRITIEREQVEKPKKEKHKDKGKKGNSSPEAQLAVTPSASAEKSEATASDSVADSPSQGIHFSEINTPAHASQKLIGALDRVFAQEIDDLMIAEMPDFWKLYYKASASNADYSPADPGIYRQNSVDQKAKLISTIEPPSNDFAQANGVAGMALYHAVISSDGRAIEVVAGRPIGFGLDENAVETIRKATFHPAMKDGKPVPVALDVVVSFRIYSKRTSQPAARQATENSSQPVLPGPYSVQRQ